MWSYVFLHSKELIKRLGLRRAPGVEPRDLILTALLKAGKNGLSQKCLVNKTRLSRSKVYDECKILEKEELVRHESNGRRTTYYATSKIFDNLSLMQQIFGKEVFSKISDSYIPVTTQRGLHYDRFHANSLYYETKFNDDVYFEKKFNRNDDSIERLLFEYSVRIGGIITYILLQAMNSDTIKKLTFNEKLSGRSAKDYLVEEWVQNIISPVEMLKAFRKCIRDTRYDLAVNKNEDLDNNISSYELKEETIKVLTDALSRLFPNIYNELEEAHTAFPNSLEQEKKIIEQFACKHKFLLKLKDKEKHFECSKCKLHIEVLSRRLIKNKELLAKLDQKRPPTANCAKFDHQWTKRSDYNVAFTSFQCLLCGELLRFPVEQENKLKKIEEVISLKLEDRNIALCNDIEYFFHINSNEQLTINDFIKFFEGFRSGIRIGDREKFIETVSSILDILVKYEYIKELDIPYNHDPLKRVFVRNEKLNS
jgi:hypothetical protein